jgi:hypothetical protein
VPFKHTLTATSRCPGYVRWESSSRPWRPPPAGSSCPPGQDERLGSKGDLVKSRARRGVANPCLGTGPGLAGSASCLVTGVAVPHKARRTQQLRPGPAARRTRRPCAGRARASPEGPSFVRADEVNLVRSGVTQRRFHTESGTVETGESRGGRRDRRSSAWRSRPCRHGGLRRCDQGKLPEL